MDPKQYEEMLEQLEDYSLIVESIKRLDHNEDTADFSEVLCSLGISEEQLEGFEQVELD